MKKIILIGAGGHCMSCVDVIELQHKFKIVGLIDNKKEKFLLLALLLIIKKRSSIKLLLLDFLTISLF